MFDFNSLLGKPSDEELAEEQFAAGFAEGVGLAHKLVALLCEERATRGNDFVNGVIMALQEEI